MQNKFQLKILWLNEWFFGRIGLSYRFLFFVVFLFLLSSSFCDFDRMRTTAKRNWLRGIYKYSIAAQLTELDTWQNWSDAASNIQFLSYHVVFGYEWNSKLHSTIIYWRFIGHFHYFQSIICIVNGLSDCNNIFWSFLVASNFEDCDFFQSCWVGASRKFMNEISFECEKWGEVEDDVEREMKATYYNDSKRSCLKLLQVLLRTKRNMYDVNATISGM